MLHSECEVIVQVMEFPRWHRSWPCDHTCASADVGDRFQRYSLMITSFIHQLSATHKDQSLLIKQ